jgi:acyl-CoA dehydrogenase
MMNEDTVLIDAFRQMVAAAATPAEVRRVEEGGSAGPMVEAFRRSGFADALVPEAQGGAGLRLPDLYSLLCIVGEHAVPVPIGETMMIRGLVGRRGGAVPDDSLAVFGAASVGIPGGAHASHALIERDGTIALVEAAPVGPDLFRNGGATGLSYREACWSAAEAPGVVLLAAAATTSALMAGAMARVLAMTLAHARDRQQFGRPLGKFQAIQQQIAVLAEQVLSVQVAARTAFSGEDFDPARVAAAKCRANEASTLVCNIGHAVHGAIGATAEFDLQLYTRRLKAWQLAYGSESFWAERLGRLRAGAAVSTTADFLRLNLATETIAHV